MFAMAKFACHRPSENHHRIWTRECGVRLKWGAAAERTCRVIRCPRDPATCEYTAACGPKSECPTYGQDKGCSTFARDKGCPRDEGCFRDCSVRVVAAECTENGSCGVAEELDSDCVKNDCASSCFEPCKRKGPVDIIRQFH